MPKIPCTPFIAKGEVLIERTFNIDGLAAMILRKPDGSYVLREWDFELKCWGDRSYKTSHECRKMLTESEPAPIGSGPCSILIDTGKRVTDSFTGVVSIVEVSCGKPAPMIRTGRGHWYDCGGHR